MYDGNKIIPGLVIFLAILSSPIWYNVARGEAATKPDPKIVTTEKQCVESKEYMRASHMELLNTWRDDVVRRDARSFVAPNGKTYDKSLTGTCLDCHSNKTEFCDQCHNYTQVKPGCWDCHVIPEEKK